MELTSTDQIKAVGADGTITFELPAQTGSMSIEDLQTDIATTKSQLEYAQSNAQSYQQMADKAVSDAAALQTILDSKNALLEAAQAKQTEAAQAVPQDVASVQAQSETPSA